MKKTIVVFVFLAIVGLQGCGGNGITTDKEATSGTTATAHTSIISSVESTAASTTVPTGFDINMIRSDDIIIDYPKFPEYSAKINAMIKDAALRPLEVHTIYNTLDLVNEDLWMEIDYEIKLKSKDFVSIVFSGVSYLDGSFHPSRHFYTLNIDLESGKKVRLIDRVVIDDALISSLNRAAQKTLEPDIYEGYMDQRFGYGDENELIKYLTNADTYDAGNHCEEFSYFTSSKVGIVLPIAHAAGSFLQIEVPISELTMVDGQ